MSEADTARDAPEQEVTTLEGREAASHFGRKRSRDKLGENDLVVVVHDADPRVRAATGRIVRALPGMVRRRLQAMSESRIERLVEALLPEDDPFAGVEQRIDDDNAMQRARFLERVLCLTSAEVHRLAGYRGGNVSQTASAWKRQGLIFGVRHGGRDHYPAFQFADGRPRPGVRAALAALPAGMSPWQIAFWWVTGNGWLDGATPAETLERDPEAVAGAAARERREVIG
jgi:hypothetical protein